MSSKVSLLTYFFLVLDEIISVLVSRQLIADLTKPQTVYTHDEVRNIIEDVAQCSAMRLDPSSMDKLWDLITMVFKWQITFSSDLVKVTQRHLYEIENYVTQPETQLQLHRVQNLIDNFTKILDQDELNVVRESVLSWHKHFNVRVSLLLRLGLQSMEGTFVVNNTDPITQEMLRNLGENIYSVTENGKIMERLDDSNRNEPESHEMKLFVDQILGERNSSADNENVLRLSINTNTREETNKKLFDNINVETNDNTLHSILDDMNLNDDITETNFKDDLLDMIGKET